MATRHYHNTGMKLYVSRLSSFVTEAKDVQKKYDSQIAELTRQVVRGEKTIERLINALPKTCSNCPREKHCKLNSLNGVQPTAEDCFEAIKEWAYSGRSTPRKQWKKNPFCVSVVAECPPQSVK